MANSDTEIKFYGLGHLVGETVPVTILGIDMGDYTVDANGAVTVPLGSDEQGLVTADYLLAHDGYNGVAATQVSLIINDVQHTVTISAVAGQNYTGQGQTLRPALANDLGTRVNGLGKVRRSHEFAVLLNYGVKMDFGTDFSGTMDPINLTTADGETAWPYNTQYTGVYRGVLTDEYGYDSMLCWQIDRPWPAMVCAVSAYLVSEE
jgi:hypothetical protein